MPDDSDLSSIINYEEVINIIKKITNRQHYPLLETLAEKILSKLFENNKIKKVKIKIEKIDILENTSSVGIEIKKTKINES